MSNYSYATSLPAYQEAPELKKRQADELMAFISKGANCLLQLADLSGLPQSTVSGRVNDLLREGKVQYHGHTIYRDRKRKRIARIIPPAQTDKVQASFF